MARTLWVLGEDNVLRAASDDPPSPADALKGCWEETSLASERSWGRFQSERASCCRFFPEFLIRGPQQTRCCSKAVYSGAAANHGELTLEEVKGQRDAGMVYSAENTEKSFGRWGDLLVPKALK